MCHRDIRSGSAVLTRQSSVHYLIFLFHITMINMCSLISMCSLCWLCCYAEYYHTMGVWFTKICFFFNPISYMCMSWIGNTRFINESLRIRLQISILNWKRIHFWMVFGNEWDSFHSSASEAVWGFGIFSFVLRFTRFTFLAAFYPLQKHFLTFFVCLRRWPVSPVCQISVSALVTHV